MKVTSTFLTQVVIATVIASISVAISIFDSALCVAIILIGLLFVVVCLLLRFAKVNGRTLVSLIILVLLIRFAAAIFIHYSGMYPFGGGRDDLLYHRTAMQIAGRFKDGNFSLAGIYIYHWYPVFLGCLYTITSPEMLIGKAIGVWLAAISAVLIYLIGREIGNSKKCAFFISLIATCAYPSYLFYGSLLMKDTFVIPLSLMGIFLIIRLIRSFRLKLFISSLVILVLLTTLRFYAGVALFLALFVSWFLCYKLNLTLKITCAIIMVAVVGFLAQFLGHGFLGIRTVRFLLNPEFISNFREVGYSIGGSSTNIKADFHSLYSFIKYYSQSFLNVLLGPLPWQVRGEIYLFSLIELLPWYLFLFFIIKGAKKHVVLKTPLPILIYAICLVAAIALFSDNIGANTIKRMSAFVALCCLVPLGFTKTSYGKH